MITLVHFQIVSAALFSIGLYGVMARRSAILILMSIELMLNAVNINLVAVASFLDPDSSSTGSELRMPLTPESLIPDHLLS